MIGEAIIALLITGCWNGGYAKVYASPSTDGGSMAVELWLIRHGQAAFGTGDYDRLTDLGWQQSRWLGAHLADIGLPFDRICAGTLRRQQETAQAITETIGGTVETIRGFEEYDAHGLMARAGAQDQDPAVSRRNHFRKLRGLLLEWSQGRADGSETWADYNDRVRSAVTAATGGGSGRVLVASSGGTIALILMQATGLSVEQMIELNLQCRNSSITRLVIARERTYLNMFNAIPHLERQDRIHAETYS